METVDALNDRTPFKKKKTKKKKKNKIDCNNK